MLGLLTQAQMRDGERHRRQSSELVKMLLETEGNKETLQSLIAKWMPMADVAIDAYCGAVPGADSSAAKEAVRTFHSQLGL